MDLNQEQRKRTKVLMEERGFIVEYVNPDDEADVDYLWAYGHTCEEILKRHKGFIPRRITATDRMGNQKARSAVRAWKGRVKHYDHILAKGSDPFVNRLEAVPLEELPFGDFVGGAT